MLVIFLTIFLACGFVLYSKYQVNWDKTQKSLRQIKGRVEFYYNQYHNFSHSGFTQEVHDRLVTDPRLLVISIYHPKDGMIYASEKKFNNQASFLLSPVQTNRLYQDASWKGRPEYRKMLFSGITPVAMKIINYDNRVFYIEGLYEILTRNEIFDVLKWGFFAFVMCLLLSILWRLFFVNSVEQGPVQRNYGFKTMSPISQGNHQGNYQEEPFSDQHAGFKAKSSHVEEPAAKGVFDDFDEKIPFQNQEKTPTHLNEAVLKTESKSRADEFEASRENPMAKGPKCDLFSPVTGLGWESHLSQRLGFEINRTSSFNQDMVFAIIKIDHPEDLKDVTQVYSSLAKTLLDHFLFQDLAFEYDNSGFALIIPDKDLREGLSALEAFQKKIARSMVGGQRCTLSIGLTSRNGRLVSEAILLKEAKRSVEKAQQEGVNQLFAFKTDPDKYRKVISESL